MRLFLDRNLDTSRPSAHMIPRRFCSPRLRPGSTSAQVYSGRLRSEIVNFCREPERPSFPARGPKSVHTVRLFLDSHHPVLPIFMQGPCSVSCFKVFYAVLSWWAHGRLWYCMVNRSHFQKISRGNVVYYSRQLFRECL